MEPITLSNGLQVKLGRIRPKSRPNVIRLAPYIKGDIAIPATVDYTPKAKEALSHMYLNDTYGDCVIAGKGHAVGVWSGNETGTPIIATDQEIYTAYQTICGRGDNGCDITAVLDYMKQTGMTLGGQPRKIDGYVAVDWTNQQEAQVALYLFGALTLGINLPNAWAQTTDGGIWDTTNTRIVGGHDVTAVGYNETGVVISTWGSTRTITWAAFTSKEWIDECYVLLSPDWYSNNNLAPSGIDVTTLQADLQKIGNGTLPPIIPTPEPTPTPTPTPNPPTPTPAGPTLQQAVEAVVNGIENNRPYGLINTVSKVEQIAVEALKRLWQTGFVSKKLKK